jgi:hypothetical protein
MSYAQRPPVTHSVLDPLLSIGSALQQYQQQQQPSLYQQVLEIHNYYRQQSGTLTSIIKKKKIDQSDDDLQNVMKLRTELRAAILSALGTTEENLTQQIIDELNNKLSEIQNLLEKLLNKLTLKSNTSNTGKGKPLSSSSGSSGSNDPNDSNGPDDPDDSNGPDDPDDPDAYKLGYYSHTDNSNKLINTHRNNKALKSTKKEVSEFLINFIINCTSNDPSKSQSCIDIMKDDNKYLRVLSNINLADKELIDEVLKVLNVTDIYNVGYIKYDRWSKATAKDPKFKIIKENPKLLALVKALIKSKEFKNSKPINIHHLETLEYKMVQTVMVISDALKTLTFALNNNPNMIEPIMLAVKQIKESIENNPSLAKNKYVVVNSAQHGGASHTGLTIARGTQAKLIESLFNTITKKLSLQNKEISVNDVNKFRVLLMDMNILEDNLMAALQILNKYETKIKNGVTDDSNSLSIEEMNDFISDSNNNIVRLAKRHSVAFNYMNSVNKLFTIEPVYMQ